MKPLKKILTAGQSIAGELILIILYIILVYTYLGKKDPVIKSDGVGYYDYLPSIFIHKDLNRKHVTAKEDIEFYKRVEARGVYPDYKEYVVNKYACGTALLQLPFFLYAYQSTDLEGSFEDGYQEPFQKAVSYAAIFYLFLAIFFLKKLLRRYKVRKYIIRLSQFLLIFATQITIYANFDATFSHIYSLFAITAFLFFTKLYFSGNRVKDFLLASVFFGLIIILRQINILILLILPFMAGSCQNLRDGVIYILKKPLWFLFGIAIVLAIFSIQSITWYLQTGELLLYSYGNESGFNFLSPKFFKVLFSYRSGLFVYTPLALIFLLSTLWLVYRQKIFLFFSWFGFFVLLTFVISSWYSWMYGASYGLRAYLEFYPVFIIPFAIFLNESVTAVRSIAIVLAFLTVPLNIIQSYQYQHAILHWLNMNKEDYWKVFLRTGDKFKWILWKKHLNEDNSTILEEISIGDKIIQADKHELIFQIMSSEISGFKNVNIIELLIDHNFPGKEETRILLAIKNPEDEKGHYFWQNTPLVHFADKKFNTDQTGLLDYRFAPVEDDKNREINLVINTSDSEIHLKNVRVRFIQSGPKTFPANPEKF